MTLADITNRISFYTSATAGASGQFKDADRLIAINKAYNDVHIKILQSMDEVDFDDANNTTDFPILTTDLVASQQDYKLPTDVTNVKRLEITFDGTTWNRVTPFDINEDSNGTSTTNINDDFSSENPYYDLMAGSLLLYPIPDTSVTGGLKIWIDRNVTEFTSGDVSAGTKEPGFDKQFHNLIALKASIDWLIAKTDNFATSDRLEREALDMEIMLIEQYGRKQKDRNAALGAANIGTAEWE